MCGVFLFFDRSLKENQILIDQIYQDLKRRGPDDGNIINFENISLGHTRLSLVDLGLGGKQPKTDHNQRFFLSFNGELYNWVELALKYNLNHCTGDTDLLFNLLIKFPAKEILSEIDGPYALIFYDKNKDEIIIARDQFGEKPLYFYEDNSKKIICSSINFIFNLETFTPPKLKKYFVDLLDKGFYLPDNVRSIKPGTIEVFKNFTKNNSKQISYLNPKKKINSKLFDILMNSLKVRSRLDVDFSVLLSGGVDSSLTTAMLCDLGFKPKCYTVAKDKDSFEYFQAKKIAKKFDLKLELVTLNNDLISYFNYYNSQFSPLSDTAGFPLYCGTKQIRKEYKCAFVGDGADEAFMGYPRYQFSYLLNKCNYKFLKKIFEIMPNSIFNSEELKKINSPLEFLSLSLSRNKSNRSLIELNDNTYSDLSKIMKEYDETQRLPEYLMLKSDNNSMCHGVELRSMFLSRELFSFAKDLTFFDNWKYGLINKKLLREILNNKYSIKIESKKRGFYVDYLSQLKKLMNIVLKTSIKYHSINKFLNDLIQSESFEMNLRNVHSFLVFVFTALPKNFKNDIYFQIKNY